MKNCTLVSLLACLWTAPLLFADYNLENVGGSVIEGIGEVSSPYQFEVSGDWIGDSKFTKDSVEGDHIRYGTLEVEFEVAGCYDACRGEGFNIALSYEFSDLNWDFNPFFDKSDFNT